MRKVLIATGKILAYAVAVVIVDICLMGISKTLFGYWIKKHFQNGGELLHEGLFLILSIIIVNLLISYLFKSDDLNLGWPKFNIGLKWFLKGSLLGLITASGMLILTIILDGGKIIIQDFDTASYLTAVLPLLMILLIASLSEEWFFRGYPLTILSNITGRFWAVVVFAILFSVAHLSSTGMNWIVFVNIIIGGLIVGALRFTKGGIPTAWGFHFVWNGTIVIVGATLTGEQLFIPGISFIPKGSLLVSGGELGPEGGIGATIATLLVLLVIGLYFLKINNVNLVSPIKIFNHEKKF